MPAVCPPDVAWENGGWQKWEGKASTGHQFVFALGWPLPRPFAIFCCCRSGTPVQFRRSFFVGERLPAFSPGAAFPDGVAINLPPPLKLSLLMPYSSGGCPHPEERVPGIHLPPLGLHPCQASHRCPLSHPHQLPSLANLKCFFFPGYKYPAADHPVRSSPAVGRAWQLSSGQLVWVGKTPELFPQRTAMPRPDTGAGRPAALPDPCRQLPVGPISSLAPGGRAGQAIQRSGQCCT